jgi:hypothetical protein
MPRIDPGLLIQASNAAPPDASVETTKQTVIEKHLGAIHSAMALCGLSRSL